MLRTANILGDPSPSTARPAHLGPCGVRRLAAAVFSAGACYGAVGEACLAQFESECAQLQHVPASRDGKQRRQAAALHRMLTLGATPSRGLRLSLGTIPSRFHFPFFIFRITKEPS